MKNFVLLFVGLIYLNLFACASSFPQKEMLAQNRVIVDAIVSEYSKDLPYTIDKYTTLVSVKAKDMTINYTFEIANEKKSDKQIIDEDKSRMKMGVVLGVCKSSKRLLDVGIYTLYSYISASSKSPLFEFLITPKECQIVSK